MKIVTRLLAASALTTIAAGVAGAESWDMPMAYPATNYHTENGVAFAEWRVGDCGPSGRLSVRGQ